MNITKIGHCCLFIKDNGKTILTDPGAWTTEQNNITGVDIVIITHEHPDHFHMESVKQVLKNNPDAVVVSNSRIASLLAEESIAATILEDSQKETIDGISLAAYGAEHAVIYPLLPTVMNTGFLVQDRFFYPGDAFTNPLVPIEILAMPMIGPWMKLSESMDWVKELNPKICIPVHDGMLHPRPWIYGLPTKVLPDWGITFDIIEPGDSREY
jgi:L-ascorbate metabolism protein UlaG (beta-lactamase superfamily)